MGDIILRRCQRKLLLMRIYLGSRVKVLFLELMNVEKVDSKKKNLLVVSFHLRLNLRKGSIETAKLCSRILIMANKTFQQLPTQIYLIDKLAKK